MNPPPTPPEEGSQCQGTLAEFPSWEGSGVGRFMESPLSFFRMHWDHEPPLTRPSATLSPSDGERDGVRGRFMEREEQSRSLRHSHALWCGSGAWDLPGLLEPGGSAIFSHRVLSDSRPL